MPGPCCPWPPVCGLQASSDLTLSKTESRSWADSLRHAGGVMCRPYGRATSQPGSLLLQLLSRSHPKGLRGREKPAPGALPHESGSGDFSLSTHPRPPEGGECAEPICPARTCSLHTPHSSLGLSSRSRGAHLPPLWVRAASGPGRAVRLQEQVAALTASGTPSPAHRAAAPGTSCGGAQKPWALRSGGGSRPVMLLLPFLPATSFSDSSFWL